MIIRFIEGCATPPPETRHAAERQPRCIGGGLADRFGAVLALPWSPGGHYLPDMIPLIWLAALLIAFAAIGLAMPAGQ